MTRLQLSLQFCTLALLAEMITGNVVAQETQDVSEYARCLAKAGEAWKTHRPALAWEQLENCPPEHRGWEWHYLRQSCIKMRDLGEHQGVMINLAFSGNGGQLRSTTDNGAEFTWSLTADTAPQTRHMGATLLAIHDNPTGRCVVVATGERIFWRCEKDQRVYPLGACANANMCQVACSNDGARVAVMADGKTLKVWETGTGKELQSFTDEDASFGSIALSPNGKHLAAASAKHDAGFVWDIESGKLIRKSPGAGGQQLVYSPKGEWLAVAENNGSISICETAEYRVLTTLTGHTSQATLAFRGDGKVLVSGGQDKQIKFWDITTGKETRTLMCEGPVWKVALSPDGSRIAANTGNRVVVFEHANFQPPTMLSSGPAGWIRSLAIHPHGSKMATAENDGSIALWEIGKEQPGHRLRGHEGSARSLAYSPDGARLVSAGSDGTLRVWDTVTARELLCIKGHQRIVRSVSFASDNKRIASAGDDGLICVWDSISGEELLKLGDKTRPVYSLAFSPDGKVLAATVAGGDIHLWELGARKIVRTYHGHNDIANCVVFSPDGQRLASASNDRTVRVWELQGKLLHTLRGHDGNVQSVAFSPDGKRLTSAGWDKCVRFWDAQTGQMVFQLEGGAMINSIAYGPGGNYLAIAGFDRQPCVWNALPQ